MTGKKPLGVRWVDIKLLVSKIASGGGHGGNGDEAHRSEVGRHRGDTVNREYSSGFVAKETKLNKCEDQFAATPPLQAEKAMFLMAVAEGTGFERFRCRGGMRIEFNRHQARVLPFRDTAANLRAAPREGL